MSPIKYVFAEPFGSFLLLLIAMCLAAMGTLLFVIAMH